MALASAVLPSSPIPNRPVEDELGRLYEMFSPGDSATAPLIVRRLRDTIAAIRSACASESEWRDTVEHMVRRHPILAVALGDPFVNRANVKPRGYAGDAVMLDFIYQHPSRRVDIDRLPVSTRSSMQFTTNSPSARAVRNRAALLAAEVDATAARKPRPSILSMACGHLREAPLSHAVCRGDVGRYLAIDQDPESLAVVQAEAGPLGVETREGSVKTVIARGHKLGRFDFVYAAGLYDYLNDKVAARLLQALFAMLEPGGKVWVANFMPNIEDRAFMEAFMDWWLIYRDEREMLALAEALPQAEIASRRVFTEHEENIVFLEVVRRG